MKQDIVKIKYFLYCRKSTDEKDRQVLSLESQEEEALKRFKDLKITKLSPESVSAFKPYKRPIFNEMIERIKKGEAQGIVAWHPDRLCRNAIDAAQIVYLLDTGHIKDLKFVSYTFDNSPEGKMMLQIVMSQSKYSSDKLSTDVKRGMDKKAATGWRPGLAALGYLNSKTKLKGEQDLSSDPERFHLVKQLFQLMLTGNYTVPKLVEIANNKLSLTMPATRQRPQRKITMTKLYTMFTGTFYYGWYEWPKKSGNWQKGKHEAMITEEEYDRIQFLLGRKGKPRPKTHKFAFTGLMKCGSCGAMITAEEKYKKLATGNVQQYIYYHCTKRKNPDCPERSVELNNLSEQIDNILAKLTISDRFQKWAIEYLHEIRKEEAETQEVSLTAKQNSLIKITKDLDNLVLKFTSSENAEGQFITDLEYQTLKSRLLKEKSLLEEELHAQGKAINEWVELSEKTFNFARYARVWFANGDLDTKRAIFACLGSNLMLKDQKVLMELQKPLKFIFDGRDLVEQELEGFEPSKFVDTKRKTANFVARRFSLSG